MNTPTNAQIINGIDGKPAFVVIPYNDYVTKYGIEHSLIPNQVVSMVIEKEYTPMRAWREYLSLTQDEIATRLNITQADFAQLEASEKLRKSILRRVAKVFGLTIEQLNF